MIDYMTKMDQVKSEYRTNLGTLMSMGFTDFDKNLQLLSQHGNNLDVVCSKILEA
jgi:hypothetical protein